MTEGTAGVTEELFRGSLVHIRQYKSLAGGGFRRRGSLQNALRRSAPAYALVIGEVRRPEDQPVVPYHPHVAGTAAALG